MIPLRDVIPSRTFPFFTVSFIVLNSLAFLFEQSLPTRELEQFLHIYGVVPARFDAASVFTSMFLHAGWMHFLFNMLFLWIFGDNVEDRLGHARFVVFYLLCGVAAALAHVYMNPASRIPTIGASGAIAGVMGAYFVLYPNSRVLALVPLFIVFEVIEVPAILFLGIWFLMQFFYGVGSMAFRTGAEAGGGVAFWAHIAGFVAGVAGVLVLRKPSRTRWRSEVM
jgi:membrane associated rhomboid family serine protease